jgi:arylsulfatase A-like enzyme
MKRKIVFDLVLFILLTAYWVNSDAATNLVLFVADDMGWGDVGYHDSEIRTPNIDRLAAEGMRLERFYVHPLCSPTRGALMTGRSPLTTGLLLPTEPWYSSGLPVGEKLLPEYLKDAGYQTFAVGKWHLGPNRLRYHPQNRGFDHFYGHLGGFINYDLHTIWRGVDWQRNGRTVVEDGYSTHLITDEAVRLIKARDKDAPMFLYVTFNAPHSPLQAPESATAGYAELDDMNRRIYAAMVTEMDRGIGQVLATLESEGTRLTSITDFRGEPCRPVRHKSDSPRHFSSFLPLVSRSSSSS